MSQYIDRWVPILDEHTVTDDDGNPITVLDGKKLAHIAAVNNKRAALTGDLSPIVIGHTDDNKPEQQQPEIVGWIKAYKVGPLFRTGKKALYALARFYKHLRDKINRYPRRSVELWLSDWKIDPLSLLGATTPDRDLGLLQLSAGGVKKYKRTFPKGPNMDPTNAKDIVNSVVAAIRQTDVWKWAEAQMSQSQAPQPSMDMDMGMGDGFDDDMGTDLDAGMDMDGQSPDGLDDSITQDNSGMNEGQGGGLTDLSKVNAATQAITGGNQPVQMAAGPAMPGGTNTFTPGMAGDRKRSMTPTNPPANPAKKFARKEELKKYKKAVSKMHKDFQETQLKFARITRERDLLKLVQEEGLVFDVNEELEYVAELPQAAYEKHIALARKRYSKSPVGRVTTDFSVESRLDTGETTQDQAMAIVDYATAHNLSYPDAMVAMQGRKV